MPIRLDIDERDHAVLLLCGDQDQASVTGAQVPLLNVQWSGNPRLHLIIGVIGPRDLADRPVKDISHAGRVTRLIRPDGYLHAAERTASGREPPNMLRPAALLWPNPHRHHPLAQPSGRQPCANRWLGNVTDLLVHVPEIRATASRSPGQ